MTPSRKKPGVAFWATVVVVVALVYVLSFGPVCWINCRTGTCGPLISTAFRPIILATGKVRGAEPAVRWYACAGVPSGRSPVFVEGDLFWIDWSPVTRLIESTIEPSTGDLNVEPSSDAESTGSAPAEN
jgi:hypothetical protein